MIQRGPSLRSAWPWTFAALASAAVAWTLRTTPARDTMPSRSVALAAEPLPVPPSVSPSVVTAAAPAQDEPTAPEPLGDELGAMRELRATVDADPRRAERLAREGQQRFGASQDAPERASILVHALAAQGRSSEARGEAEQMVNRYPDGYWVREVEQFTGAKRHRNLRLNAEGQLEYE